MERRALKKRGWEGILGVMAAVEELKEREKGEIGEPKNIVILCIDRDNDIGLKTSVATPIVGKDEVFKAAVQLVTKDPEEADANTMFESLRVLDSLRSVAGDERYEVATIAGSPHGDMEADRKISREVQEVLGKFPAEAAILVTDGFTDQAVAPIIESYMPIISVQRFAVKHSEALETSWFIILKYAKTLVEDPKYARWIMGIPGLTILILTTLYALSLLYPSYLPFTPYAEIAFVIILGSVLVIKGFGIDRAVGSLVSEVVANPSVLINTFGTIAGIVICILGVNQGFFKVSREVPGEYLSDLMAFLTHFNYAAATFIEGTIDYFVIGVSIVFIGRTLYYVFKRSRRVWSNSIGLIAVIIIGETLRRATGILKEPASILTPPALGFLAWIVLGILAIIISTIGVHKLEKKFAQHFPNP